MLVKLRTWVKEELEKIKNSGRFRTRDGSFYSIDASSYNSTGGQIKFNLSNNDYLGLSNKLGGGFSEKSGEIYSQIGSGSLSSRILSGNHQYLDIAEAELSKFYPGYRSLIFSTGYNVNIAVPSLLARRSDLIFSDRLCHASLIDGIVISRAENIRYRHCDNNNLADLLKKASVNRKKDQRFVIITESVFSMNGDYPDFKSLTELRNKYEAELIVDEAHAFGVFGSRLEGLSYQYSPTLITGTFSKSLASIGGFMIASEDLIDLAVNKSRSFIFDTSLPPVLAGFAQFGLTYLGANNDLGEKLLKRARFFYDRLEILNVPGLMGFNSHIIPILVGPEDKTIQIASKLKSKGLLVSAIRPPTVEYGASRLRISINLNYSEDDYMEIADLVHEVIAKI